MTGVTIIWFEALDIFIYNPTINVTYVVRYISIHSVTNVRNLRDMTEIWHSFTAVS